MDRESKIRLNAIKIYPSAFFIFSKWSQAFLQSLKSFPVILSSDRVRFLIQQPYFRLLYILLFTIDMSKGKLPKVSLYILTPYPPLVCISFWSRVTYIHYSWIYVWLGLYSTVSSVKKRSSTEVLTAFSITVVLMDNHRGFIASNAVPVISEMCEPSTLSVLLNPHLANSAKLMILQLST